MTPDPERVRSKRVRRLFAWLAGIHLTLLIIPFPPTWIVAYLLTGLPGQALKVFGIATMEGELFSGPTVPALIFGYLAWCLFHLGVAALYVYATPPKTDRGPAREG